MVNLLRLADRQSICPDFTRRLLAAFAQRSNPVEEPVAEALLEPFSERVQGSLAPASHQFGCTEKIAEKLVILTNTVRTHIKSLYRKLDARQPLRSHCPGQGIEVVVIVPGSTAHPDRLIANPPTCLTHLVMTLRLFGGILCHAKRFELRKPLSARKNLSVTRSRVRGQA